MAEIRESRPNNSCTGGAGEVGGEGSGRGGGVGGGRAGEGATKVVDRGKPTISNSQFLSLQVSSETKSSENTIQMSTSSKQKIFFFYTQRVY